MSRMTSLEKELTEKCFEAEREAGRCHRNGDMVLYKYYLGQSNAYRFAAQATETFFENRE